MKNKALVIMIVILAFVLAMGIGVTAGILVNRREAALEAEEDEEEDDEDDEEEEKAEDLKEEAEAAPAQEDEEPEASEPEDTPDETAQESDRSWRDAYISYMDSVRSQVETSFGGTDNVYNISLIYVNDDDIPELVYEGSCEAEGCQIVTARGTDFDVLQTGRLYFYYVERGNVLVNSDGNSGYYHDSCFCINDQGVWESLGEGFTEETFDSEGEVASVDYTWDGEAVSKSEYEEKLKEITGDQPTREFEQGAGFDGMYEFLKSDDPMSEYEALVWPADDPAIHEYRIVTEDTTWYSALWDSAEKYGGYLVRINSQEEFDHIVDLIEQAGMENYVFYTAGARNYSEPGEPENPYRWRIDDGTFMGIRYEKAMIDKDPELSGFWMEGEPSYTGLDLNGKEEEEDVVCLLHSGKENRFVLNDVPEDLTPYYPGKIAYIVEIE